MARWGEGRQAPGRGGRPGLPEVPAWDGGQCRPTATIGAMHGPPTGQVGAVLRYVDLQRQSEDPSLCALSSAPACWTTMRGGDSPASDLDGAPATLAERGPPDAGSVPLQRRMADLAIGLCRHRRRASSGQVWDSTEWIASRTRRSPARWANEAGPGGSGQAEQGDVVDRAGPLLWCAGSMVDRCFTWNVQSCNQSGISLTLTSGKASMEPMNVPVPRRYRALS